MFNQQSHTTMSDNQECLLNSFALTNECSIKLQQQSSDIMGADCQDNGYQTPEKDQNGSSLDNKGWFLTRESGSCSAETAASSPTNLSQSRD